MPLRFIEHYQFGTDLFISIWGLSETSRYAQDFVVSQRWFNAKHILLAYGDSNETFPDSDRVGKLAKDIGAAIEDIEFLRASHYAFR